MHLKLLFNVTLHEWIAPFSKGGRQFIRPNKWQLVFLIENFDDGCSTGIFLVKSQNQNDIIPFRLISIRKNGFKDFQSTIVIVTIQEHAI